MLFKFVKLRIGEATRSAVWSKNAAINTVLAFCRMYMIVSLLAFFSCINNSPNLPEKQLRELMNEIATAPVFVLPDTGYMPPAGSKYAEIRSIDYAAPLAIIDIAGNLENKKTLKISDFASSVKYIYLQQPPDTKITSIRDVVSDDEHIFINALEGLFCYSAEGQYLYTVFINQLESITLGKITYTRVVSGVLFNVDLLNGKLISRTCQWPSYNEVRLNVFDVKELDVQMRFNHQSGELKNFNPQPKYQRRIPPKKDNGLSSRYLLMDEMSLFISNSLTGVAVYGDTLCKFSNYDQPVIDRVFQQMGAGVYEPSNVYRINGQIMLKTGFNDTVFRITPPNRLTPVYVMNWGNFKPDISAYVAGSDLEGKLALSSLVETRQFIFIHYTEGRDFPRRRDEGKVKDKWAVYDKTAKTVTHHISSDEQVMFENDIEPAGMPFYPTGINHRDEMYMTFSKEKIKNYITTGKYRNDKLQIIYDNMIDDGFYLMIVK